MSQSSRSKNRTLEDLKQANDLKDVTSTIKLEDKATIDKYYGDEIYPYYMNWAHNVMAVHWQVRFAEIDFGNDTVLFAYKNVSFFAVKYYRILFYPKSLNGIREHEDAVYEEIIKDERVTEIVTKEPHGKPYDYDFYIDVQEKFKEIDRSKFRSKHRINILKNTPHFGLREATVDDREGIEVLINDWKKSKGKDYSGAVFKGFLKDFEMWVTHKDIKVIVMEWRNVVLGVYVYVNTTNNNYYQIINIAVTPKTLDMDVKGTTFGKILTDIAQINLYFTLEMFCGKVDKISFAGGRIPSLVKYKQRAYKNCIKYYRKKLERNQSWEVKDTMTG